MDIYCYRISSTNHGSDWFGSCEVCGKYCSEVFGQTKEREYKPGKFAYVSRMYGHERCLIEQRQHSQQNAM